MKVVLLAGGWGTRLAEESSAKPKPLVDIGEKPILWHIMSVFARHGLKDFVVCLGYKGYLIKEYFLNYDFHGCDLRLRLSDRRIEVLRRRTEDWTVTLVDTGLHTMTGGRIRRIREHVGDEPFCMTYGDGLSDVDLTSLIDFHQSHGRTATVTAVRPPGRFGTLDMNGDLVSRFEEKPVGDGGWISGGFFVLNPGVFDLIPDDTCVFEEQPLRTLAETGQLMAWQHSGFWHPMDTLRDKKHLESLWQSGNPPWMPQQAADS